MKARIRELLQARPFRPFIVHMADGQEYRIDYPDFVLASSSNQSIIIIEQPENDRIHQISALLITSIEQITDANIAA